MDLKELKKLLDLLHQQEVDPQFALEKLKTLPFSALGHSNIDTHRELRCGFEEVVFASSKDNKSLKEIVEKHLEISSRVLVTKLKIDQFSFLKSEFPEIHVNEAAKTAYLKTKKSENILGKIGVITAGTSDRNIAEEAIVTAEYFNLEVTVKNDLGVAGLPRLLAALPELSKLDALIVIAGMEGALPSVISGLISLPIIAVPTSVGYGANLGGITALLSMLVSCSPGVSVVNIDNGFGAAMVAARFIRQIRGNNL